jgi:hypothetical protein
MKWVLVIYMTMPSPPAAPGLNPNIFLGSENFATHRECVAGAKKYEGPSSPYGTWCQRGPLREQTPAEYNAEHGIR